MPLKTHGHSSGVHGTTHETGHEVSFERHHVDTSWHAPWTVSAHAIYHGACAMMEPTMIIAKAFSVAWPMGAHGAWCHGSNFFRGLTHGRCPRCHGRAPWDKPSHPWCTIEYTMGLEYVHAMIYIMAPTMTPWTVPWAIPWTMNCPWVTPSCMSWSTMCSPWSTMGWPIGCPM